MKTTYTSKGFTLLPFFVFVFTFLGAGLLLDDFYALPAPVAVLLGVVVALLLLQGPISAKIETFVRGCGEEKIITMCLIYLLAGAFATVMKAMGGVDATVSLGLSLVPGNYLALGVFLLAAFLSTATGTSVGSIVAMAPIAVGLAQQSGSPLPLLLGALLGGAMFGDNLSFISDTTIAATQTQECKMRDKFRVNLLIAGPAALLTVIFLLIAGQHTTPAEAVLSPAQAFSFWQIAPYLLVIGLAVAGVNVFSVLILGSLAAGAVGLLEGHFGLLTFSQKIYEGFTGMTEIFLLSMLTGGLAAMVSAAGGLQWVLEKVSKGIKSYRSAQLGTGAFVSFTNMAIANNTVSIVITGTLARQIAGEYGIDRRKTAALIDIASCITQGLLPYGAQMLILLSFAGSSYSFLDILPYAWYIYLLLFFSLLAIFTPYVDRFLGSNQKEAKAEEAERSLAA